MRELPEVNEMPPGMDRHNPIDMLVFCLLRSKRDRMAIERWVRDGDSSEESYWAFRACNVRGSELLAFEDEAELRCFLETQIAIKTVTG